ncbi:hypothetical protein R1sor_006660 [Riccia sorocarpa]|uniref:Uncharacterized protein n=1 Tax=Riccia sorocarpa TaxID=122646 RepID=A0ABD3HR62_9MARC
MKMLREEEKRGRLTGLGIPREDNRELRRHLRGQLNITKSMIIPMAKNVTPRLLEETGCTIMKEQEKITYLGCQIGHNMTEKEHARTIADKLTRKLANWTHWFLTWPGRVMLLRHILRAIPIYHFLSIGLNELGYKQLKSVCRFFLWGTTREGKARCPLIAWDKITCSRWYGELQIKPFDLMSTALKMKLIARLLAGDNSEWSDMIRYYIRHETRKRKYTRETKWWSAEEALILLSSIPSKELTLRHLMKSWKRIHNYLRLDTTTLYLPGSITWRQVMLLTERYAWGKPFENRTLAPVLKLLRCESLMNLADGTGRWLDVKQTARQRGIYMSPEAEREAGRLQHWLQKVELSAGGLLDSKSWRWETEQEKWSGWDKPTQFWSKLMTATIPPPPQPSNSWNIRPTADEDGSNPRTLLEEITRGIARHNHNPALPHTVAALTSNIWKDRNNRVFQNRRSQTTLYISFQEAQQTIEADMQDRGNDDNWSRGIEGLRTL